MDLAYLKSLLTLLREHGVTAFKEGDLVLSLMPPVPAFDEPVVSEAAQAGAWKRYADLSE